MTRSFTPTIPPERWGPRFRALVYGLRTSALEELEHLDAGDHHATQMMQAILIGETPGLQRAWADGFHRSFSCDGESGAHPGVLAGVLPVLPS